MKKSSLYGKDSSDEESEDSSQDIKYNSSTNSSNNSSNIESENKILLSNTESKKSIKVKKLDEFIDILNQFISDNIETWTENSTQKKFRNIVIDNVPKVKPKYKDPNKPKKTKSGYLIFMSEQRKSLSTKLENLTPQQVMKKLSELWNELPNDKKKIYNDKSLLDKERFKNEMKNYEKPKKAKSAWSIYFSEEYQKIKEKLHISEKMKILANRWKNLNPKDKEIYNKKAMKDKERYQVQMKTYIEK